MYKFNKTEWKIVLGLAIATVVFFVLKFVWEIFGLIAIGCLTICLTMLAVWRLLGYINYNNLEKEQRYQDAFLKADEQGDSINLKKFRYNRKKENNLRSIKNMHLTSVFGFFAIAICSLILLITMCINY